MSLPETDGLAGPTKPRGSSTLGRVTLLLVIPVTVVIAIIIWLEPLKNPLPVAVRYRPAVDGRSLVAQFSNKSERYLTILCTFENPTLKQRANIALSIGPHQTVEYGWLEGWAFSSGERIVLHHEDYRPLKVRVP